MGLTKKGKCACDKINQRIAEKITGVRETVHMSIDSVKTNNHEKTDLYPVEFLYSINPSGFASQKSALKKG